MTRIVRTPHTDPALRVLHYETLPADARPMWVKGWWWLAKTESGEVVGFAGLQPSYRWSDTAYLVRCGVREAHRGNGLQKRLLLVREKFARRHGFTWAISSTYRNPASANSLISRGYKLYEPSAPWGANGTLYWKKKLT